MEQAREQEIQAGTPMKADTYWRPNCQALRKLGVGGGVFLTEQRRLFEPWAVVGRGGQNLRSGKCEVQSRIWPTGADATSCPWGLVRGGLQ